MNNEKVLVTGAAGFAGSYLVKELLAQGATVRAMVRKAGSADSLRGLPVEIVEGDVKDQASLRKAMAGIGGVYHIAALYRQAGLPESEFHAVNAEGTQKALDAAVAEGVERFIHCSTVGVLGDVKAPPGTEESPFNPGDMYQRSKLEGERIALEYFRSGKMRGVVIRPAIIYGPGDTRTLKIFRMVARRKFFYVGPGDKHLHWIDVRDLAKAFVLAMKQEHLNGEVYIIPGEKAIPLIKMVQIIAKTLSVPEPKLHLPVRPMQLLGELCEAVCTPFGINPPLYRRRVDFYTKNRDFSGAKAARDLGFRPTKSVEDEIVEITNWYKAAGQL